MIPLSASLLQLVLEHQDLFLQGKVLALSIPQLLAQGLQLSAVLCLPACQLLLVQQRLLLQVSTQAPHFLGLLCRGQGGGRAGLLQLVLNRSLVKFGGSDEGGREKCSSLESEEEKEGRDRWAEGNGKKHCINPFCTHLQVDMQQQEMCHWIMRKLRHLIIVFIYI